MTILNQVYQNQLQKELTINENFQALSVGAIFADRGNHEGLSYNYYGGKFQKADGTGKVIIADGQITLVNNSINYIFYNPITELVETNTTGAITGQTEVAIITTLNGRISNIEEDRIPAFFAKGTRGDLSSDLQTASDTVKGGIKVGANLTMTGEVLSADVLKINIQDEGVDKTLEVTKMNFTGAGVTVTNTGNEVTVDIPASGGGSSIIIQDEGVNKTTAVTKMNFTGAGVTVTNTGDEVTVDIPSGGGGSSVEYYNDTRKLLSYTKVMFSLGSLISSPGQAWSTSYGGLNLTDLSSFGKWGFTPRYNFATAGTINSSVNQQNNSLSLTRGLRDRFAVHYQIGTACGAYTSNASDSVLFCGIAAVSSNGTNTIGSTNDFVNMDSACIGVGNRATDTNLQIIYKAAGNILTFIDLGSNFPILTTSASLVNAYEIIIKKIDTTNNITVVVNRLDCGNGITATSTNTITPYVVGYNYMLSPNIQLKTTVASVKNIHISDTQVYKWCE